MVRVFTLDIYDIILCRIDDISGGLYLFFGGQELVTVFGLPNFVIGLKTDVLTAYNKRGVIS